ncbi:MAG: CheR family methyltransferase [Burkholderiaceae bacterium]
MTLARPMMADTVQELETNLLLEALFQLFGSDFRGYERSIITARLSGFMQENGFTTISSLQNEAIHQRGVAAGLLRALTFRPAGAFEDLQAFRALRDLAEPLLRSYARPKVWIPECATSEEVAALAILLEEAGIRDRTVIHATCSNPVLLGEIKQGRFPIAQAEQYEENYASSGGKNRFSDYWTRKGGHAVFTGDLLRSVTFSEYNLSTDTSFNEFQLIVCRRRLPEFGAELRRRVMELFSDSLVRFGMLFTDPVDDFDSYRYAGNYSAISREHGIYRRTYRVDSSRYKEVTV